MIAAAVLPTHQTLPLSLTAPGERVRVIEIRGGQALLQRLMALGLTEGATVRVVQGDPGGPLLLALKNDTRIALGRGVAQKIMVAAIS